METKFSARQIMDRALPALLREGWRYFLVSAGALTIDYGILISLTEFAKIQYLYSAAIGFSAGTIVAYIFSLKFVFSKRSVNDRHLEFATFFLIGIFGLILNEAVIAFFVQELRASYVAAKVPAAAASFLFNFGLRRWLLFAKAPPVSQKVSTAPQEASLH